MLHHSRKCIFSILVVAVANVTFGEQPTASTPKNAPASADGSSNASFDLAVNESKIKKILVDRVDMSQSNVGIVVGMIDGNNITIVGHGRRGPDQSEAPDGNTVFEIGSITKVFTGILLADMIERDKVALDSPAAQFLPKSVKIPEFDDKSITLYHLTTHTSGLPRMPSNFTPADRTNPYADYSVEQMYDFLSNYTLTRAPGEKVLYSNLGVGLLGHILSKVAESDYETLVKNRITEPLGMTDTRIKLDSELKGRLAIGHDSLLNPVSNWDIPTLAGAGALRSTAIDMLKFLKANLDQDETELSKVMATTHQPRETMFGMGWVTTSKHDRTITWHNGGTGGYRSFIGFDKDRGRAVVVLSNTTNSVDDIGFHLLEPKFELAKQNRLTKTSEPVQTPAGQALAVWFDVLFRGDDSKVREHYDQAFSGQFKEAVPFDAYKSQGEQLFSQASRAQLQIKKYMFRDEYGMHAYANVGESWFRFNIIVQREQPHKIIGLSVRPAQPPVDSSTGADSKRK